MPKSSGSQGEAEVGEKVVAGGVVAGVVIGGSRTVDLDPARGSDGVALDEGRKGVGREVGTEPGLTNGRETGRADFHR